MNKDVKSELIIGLVGAVGCDFQRVIDILEEDFKDYGYQTVKTISVSEDIISEYHSDDEKGRKNSGGEYDRIDHLMTAGNEARKLSGNNGILAQGASHLIFKKREEENGVRKPLLGQVHIIKSLKHPDEVRALRTNYPRGFYLLGIYSDQANRIKYLTKKEKGMKEEQALALIERDESEGLDYGQKVGETFHLSDFFVNLDSKPEKEISRMLEIMFGHPAHTPTFDEYAMNLAFTSALRSADLSRQVGAVIADKENREILSLGANECPKAGGGLYWEGITPDGRDFMSGVDPNKQELDEMIKRILALTEDDAVHSKVRTIDQRALEAVLRKSELPDIIEFGRVVHAEMEALLACARVGKSTRGCTVYCTTFPCHICAKHIVAAGIKKVIYIEPYPKSKALNLHRDSISSQEDQTKTEFSPFFGIGPRKFFDLFSTKLSTGDPIRRKDSTGKASVWDKNSSKLRLQMLNLTYIEKEEQARDEYREFLVRQEEQ